MSCFMPTTNFEGTCGYVNDDGHRCEIPPLAVYMFGPTSDGGDLWCATCREHETELLGTRWTRWRERASMRLAGRWPRPVTSPVIECLHWLPGELQRGSASMTPRCPIRACPVRYRAGPDRLCPEHQDHDGDYML